MLDQPIQEWTGSGPALLSWLNSESAYGIELEYERFFPEESINLSNWEMTGDGSLRSGGVEFVSAPLRPSEFDDALSEVETLLNAVGGEATPRCGLHVHCNMRPYQIGQVWSFLTLYALMEPSIYAAYAVQREDSAFGVPLYLNTSQIRALSADIRLLRRARTRLPIERNILSTCKYSAINMGGCLAQYGTIEMRQPYCTNDFEAIRSWLAFVDRLVSHGVSFDDPLDVLDQYEREGLDSIQERLMGTLVGVDPDIQELAEDAAYFTAGFNEPTWHDLEWDAPTLEVD